MEHPEAGELGDEAGKIMPDEGGLKGGCHKRRHVGK